MPSRRWIAGLRRPGLLVVLDLVLGCGYGLLGWVIVDYQVGAAWVVVVAAGVAAVSVAVCRRWLLVGYLTALTGNGIALAFLFLSGGGALWLAFLATPPMAYALFRIGSRHRMRWSVAALPPGLACPIVVLAVDGSIGPFFPIPLVLAPALLIGYAERRYHQQVVWYHARRAEIERDRSRLAVAEERIRIARELHDVISHGMSVITVQAGFAGLVIEQKPDQARAALGAIETTGRQVLGELRQMLAVLRAGDAPPAVGPAPGLAGVDQLVAQTGRAGVRADLTVTGQARDLPPGIEQTVYRFIQEALTNVVRHAQTDTCRVRIEYACDAVTAEVTDDGRGGPAGQRGLGLTGMRERAQRCGGQLEAGPLPDRGFRVAVRLPLVPLHAFVGPLSTDPDAGAAHSAGSAR
jgi:signal transduction histidine kinase